MNDELCLEKHKRVDEKLDLHDRRLNNHEDRLDKLEQGQSEFKIEIKNFNEYNEMFYGNLGNKLA